MALGRKRSGRRPGSPDTREEILAAARDTFAAEGFERSSIRKIAAAAGVDPALVHHYFGTKDKLFLAAIEAPFDPSSVIPQIFAAGIDNLGERLVTTFVQIWDSPTGNRAEAFLRSAISHPQMSKLVQQFILQQIIRKSLSRLDPQIDHLELRGNLIASQLLGLAVTRHIMKFAPLRELSPEAIGKIYGPTIQRYLMLDLNEIDLPPSA